MSTQIVLPDELVNAIDTLVGKGKRSRFIEEAIRDKLRSESLLSALENTSGILSDVEHPEWANSDQVATWVREVRRNQPC